jgi:hypothetical protein
MIAIAIAEQAISGHITQPPTTINSHTVHHLACCVRAR